MPAKRFILFVVTMGVLYIHSQSTCELRLIPLYNNQPVYENAYLSSGRSSDSIQFSQIKFYMSCIQLYKKDKCVWNEPENYHLVDLFDAKRSALKIPVIDFDKIIFCLGLDSIVNTSGALGGDLDPTIGMYWAWQSGYINTKIEGKYKDHTNRGKNFTYHLGGYLSPFATLQKIELAIATPGEFIIQVDLEKFINSINLRDQKDIMSPGSKAVELSSSMAKCFKVKTGE